MFKVNKPKFKPAKMTKPRPSFKQGATPSTIYNEKSRATPSTVGAEKIAVVSSIKDEAKKRALRAIPGKFTGKFGY